MWAREGTSNKGISSGRRGTCGAHSSWCLRPGSWREVQVCNQPASCQGVCEATWTGNPFSWVASGRPASPGHTPLFPAVEREAFPAKGVGSAARSTAQGGSCVCRDPSQPWCSERGNPTEEQIHWNSGERVCAGARAQSHQSASDNGGHYARCKTGSGSLFLLFSSSDFSIDNPTN